jgi:hypothetical protein
MVKSQKKNKRIQNKTNPQHSIIILASDFDQFPQQNAETEHIGRQIEWLLEEQIRITVG